MSPLPGQNPLPATFGKKKLRKKGKKLEHKCIERIEICVYEFCKI
jgi:hypothetical protein